MRLLKYFFIFSVLIFGTVSCSPAADAVIPPELRAGQFSCDQSTIQAALALKAAGWAYIMPQPKSPEARWGNTDGRTTWWVGYWKNGKTSATSAAQPAKGSDGQLAGDGNGGRAWRRGGSPRAPTKIEWLCSTSGGIAPN